MFALKSAYVSLRVAMPSLIIGFLALCDSFVYMYLKKITALGIV